MSIADDKLKNIIEAALMAVGKPMSIEQLTKLFEDEEMPAAARIKDALTKLQQECEGRGVELKEIASGYRYQARQDYAEWLGRLWEEKPAKYSRAYLETLALIAYRQPVTRAEIEEVRGVSVSSTIIKTMLEREWIRIVGHRDVPGRPSLYATTKQFLDYFNMKSLEDLPSLAEIRDLEDLSPELDLSEPGSENTQPSADSINKQDEDADKLSDVENSTTDLSKGESHSNDVSEVLDNQPDNQELGEQSEISAQQISEDNEAQVQENEAQEETSFLDEIDNDLAEIKPVNPDFLRDDFGKPGSSEKAENSEESQAASIDNAGNHSSEETKETDSETEQAVLVTEADTDNQSEVADPAKQ
ncbi:SMC-Scp complex subunit ScpB [Aliikangiella maris]|uniref:SMC-Scp complex subunit ScpB n=2 Tax=Aliikangiella maris TaxID=3162458 RepID=A0ABV2BW90_9GAMM